MANYDTTHLIKDITGLLTNFPVAARRRLFEHGVQERIGNAVWLTLVFDSMRYSESGNNWQCVKEMLEYLEIDLNRFDVSDIDFDDFDVDCSMIELLGVMALVKSVNNRNSLFETWLKKQRDEKVNHQRSTMYDVNTP